MLGEFGDNSCSLLISPAQLTRTLIQVLVMESAGRYSGNVVITKSLDRDMIVADHMNQVNLRCEPEGNPSVSFIWCSKNQT
jgi:hypothetical protein